jgi:hypothetical protein
VVEDLNILGQWDGTPHLLFCTNLFLKNVLLNDTQLLICIALLIAEWLWIIGGMIATEINLPQYHLVHHKPYMD